MQKIFFTSQLIVFLFLTPFSFANASCDCGSTDSANPCTGQSISVTVKAGTPNNGVAVDSVYNWSFNSGGGNARCGQFANGDYWIAPANGQTTVTINSITTTSPGEISADADPQIESMGLLSSTKTYGNYNADENIIPNLPLSYGEITSVVAAIQRNEAVEGGCGTSAIVGNCANSYNVVTILEAIPENAGATVIRPNITGQTKEILSFSDFDFTRLPAKDFLSGASADGYETIRLRWSHSTEIFGVGSSLNGNKGYSEGGRAFRSHTLIDDYGGGVATAWYNDMMVIFSDENPLEEKKSALAAMFAYGLDIYHSIYNPPLGVERIWLTGATQHPGKFMPPVFLAALEKDETHANNLKTVSAHCHDTSMTGPLELAQVHEGVNGYLWGDDPNLSGIYYQGSYWANLKSSQCYDEAPEQVKYDYYDYGKWKTFNIPVGEFATGLMHFTIWATPDSGVGDVKIRNVSIDGAPINFNNVALQNYDNDATADGIIEDGGATYNITSGLKVKKQTVNTYEITPDSILVFDWYQDARGTADAIGFDEDAIYHDVDGLSRLLQMSGSWKEGGMIQRGCNPSIGSKTMLDPYGYIDGPPNRPGTSYMSSSLGVQKSMVAVMLIMPKIREIINYEPLIEYVNRITSYGIKTAPDPCVTPDSREDFTNCDPYRNRNCLYYGVTWGPVDPTDKNSACITVPTLPYNKVGRFTSLDGNPQGIGYASGQVTSNWETISALYNVISYRADVDGSLEITTTDALLTLRNSLGLSMTGTAWQVSATTGDVNCDGVSNSTDALLILRYSLGLSMSETSWCE